jgi:hypothetical protein
MVVVFTANYFFSERRRPVNSDVFLVINFVNLKIKSVQSFGCSHKIKACVSSEEWVLVRV